MKQLQTATSRRLKMLLFIMMFSFCLFEAIGQEITNADLNKINGEWKGVLSYTDYGDDKTQYELNTNLTAEWKGGKGRLKFYYTEPNGKVVTSTEKMKLVNASVFQFDEEWDIKAFERKSDSWSLTLEIQGKDNNRDATIRQTITVSKNTFVIKKMVRYSDADSFFQRNSQSFSK